MRAALPPASALLVPLMLVSLMIAVLGVGVLMSAVTVAYRDFRHVLPFLLRLMFFLTPVIYPVTIVPEAYRWLLSLNPVGGTIAGLRSALKRPHGDFGKCRRVRVF